MLRLFLLMGFLIACSFGLAMAVEKVDQSWLINGPEIGVGRLTEKDKTVLLGFFEELKSCLNLDSQSVRTLKVEFEKKLVPGFVDKSGNHLLFGKITPRNRVEVIFYGKRAKENVFLLKGRGEMFFDESGMPFTLYVPAQAASREWLCSCFLNRLTRIKMVFDSLPIYK